MKRSAPILLAAALCIYPIHIESARAALLDDEYAFHCAALYGILEKVYAELGDEQKSRSYGSKFQKLELEIWKLFDQSESGRKEAGDKLQKNVNEIAAVFSMDRTIMPDLIENCDSGLQTFQGL
ncbi:MAG: hypothetical protein ABI414_06540 [Devosia sp.]